VAMVGGVRKPLSPAVQRAVAAIIIRLASRAQYSKVCTCLRSIVLTLFPAHAFTVRVICNVMQCAILVDWPKSSEQTQSAVLRCAGQYPEQHRVSRSGAHGVHRPGPGPAHHARALRGGHCWTLLHIRLLACGWRCPLPSQYAA